MKNSSIFVLALVFALVSCNKDVSQNKKGNPYGITSTADIVSPSSFNWKAHRTVDLNLGAWATTNDQPQVVKVVDSRGNILVSRVMVIDNQSELHFQLPNSDHSVHLIVDGENEEMAVSARGNQAMAIKKGKKKPKKPKGSGGSSCACDGKMQSFTVVYNGSPNATLGLYDKGKKGQAYAHKYDISGANPGDTIVFNGFDSSGRFGAKSFIDASGTKHEIHTSCSVDIMGLVVGPFTVIAYTDGNGAVCNGNPPPPPPPGTPCPCNGKMQSFTVVYSGSGITTLGLYDKGKKGQSHAFKYDIPNVAPGSTVVFNGFDSRGRFGAKSYVDVNGTKYEIHTSCSQDILGLIAGPLTVVAYTDGDGVPCGPTACVDTDGDGCCDKDDAYPNDPTKCDVVNIPGENVYGSYAWEDLWPAKGDFDFNDKIIDRNTVLALDGNGDVIQATHKFVLKAAGAAYKNGFGFSMPGIAPSEVVSVTSSYIQPQNYTAIEINGTESGQSEAVVIVYENWEDIVTFTQVGTFFNTLKNASAGLGYADTITVTVVFNNPQLVATALELDPFLIRDGNRGAEVHLPWHGPTDLADLSLLGTQDDSSAYPAMGNNYVSSNNIPWAIETPLSAYEWPIENIDIVNAYYDFASWAMMGTPSNWYSNGNRDATKIY